MHKASYNPSSKRLVAALSAAFGLLGLQVHATASVLPVTSCADDGAPGTLRQVAASAAHGDVIDLSGLGCSTITLTQGEVALPVSVTLNGPAGGSLTLTTTGGRVLNALSADSPAYLNVQNLTISGGQVYTSGDFADGGCIFASGNVNLSNTTVKSCTAHAANAMARGGAIYAQSVTLASSKVTGNAASATGSYQLVRGGGIYATSLSCSDSSISDNLASADPETMLADGGGAMLVGGDMRLSGCTVSGNTADTSGGLKHQASAASSTLIQNSTISGNTAHDMIGGVAVFCSKCSPVVVEFDNSTVAFNTSTSPYGGGVSSNAPIVAQSTVFANNSAGAGGFADIFAPDMSGADNLVQSTNVQAAPGVVTVTADPLLLPLADNGGPTLTHALGAASPALQLGNNAAGFASDQRGAGYARSVGGFTDIGAFQTQASSTQRLPPGDPVFSSNFD